MSKAPVDASSPPPPLAARGCAPTTNAHLRARIAELVDLAAKNDIDAFVAKFIPRDLEGSEDAAYFLESLKTDAERWTLLAREVARVDAGGPEVRVISGDQITKCEFRFEMPGEIERGSACVIDREVEFANYAAPGDAAEDWRAVG